MPTGELVGSSRRHLPPHSYASASGRISPDTPDIWSNLEYFIAV
jgi:hypothetical protein